jgi:uncharacterized protein (PEP-CTERM system associated)
LSAGVSTLLACSAWAARWDIVPTLAVVETYTDNVSLTSDAFKQSDWVTQAIPGISVAATGARLRFNANYNPEFTYYGRETQENQVFHRGNAVGVAEIAKQLLFIDAGAAVNQYDISPQGPVTTSNINSTGNRATVENYFASPYLRRIGANLQAEARFTYSVVRSDDQPELLNSVADRIDLRLASGPAHRSFTWGLAYQKENIRYDETQQDTDIEVSSATARALITYTLALTGQVGYDYYKRGVLVPASEGWAWSAGFDWTPSPRTRFAAAGGERFYGDYYSLDFRHRTRLTTWSAGYSQSVTTTRSEFFIPATTSTAGYLDTLFSSRFPDPVERQKVVDEFIARTGLPPSLDSPINFFTTQLFLAKRWQASTGLLGVRNVLIANVFQETREGLAGDLVLPNAPNAAKQTGTSLAWNLRMTVRNSLNARGAYIHIETPLTGESERVTYVGVNITRQFQPKLTGALGYRRQQNDSNFVGSSYTENAGFATLQMRF